MGDWPSKFQSPCRTPKPEYLTSFMALNNRFGFLHSFRGILKCPTRRTMFFVDRKMCFAWLPIYCDISWEISWNDYRWAICLKEDMVDIVLPHSSSLQELIVPVQRLFVDVEIDHSKDIVIHPGRMRVLDSTSVLFFSISTFLALYRNWDRYSLVILPSFWWMSLKLVTVASESCGRDEK